MEGPNLIGTQIDPHTSSLSANGMPSQTATVAATAPPMVAFSQEDEQTVAGYTSSAPTTDPTYTNTSSIDKPVTYDGTVELRYYHRTQQYSVTALTDSLGAIKERYAYDAYGELSIFDGSGTARTATAEGNRYTYTGREYDDVVDLYHYRARMYDAIAVRFCSRDPIGYFRTNWSLYEYVSSMPLDNTDPTGLFEHGGPPWHDPGPERPPRPEIRKPSDLCALIAGKCPGCSKAECDRVMGVIEDKACGEEHYYSMPEKCQKYTNNVYPKIFMQNITSPCIGSIEQVYFTWWVVAGHAAIKVTLCNGEVFYLDYGATSISGTTSHRCQQFGLPEDVPPWIW
ncbi:hypothetical protein CKO51_30925 [Rhodopirellula sp. SM50]|nr:RHS repeat-associated core domain-containing protein [Rhodopirellula sp. SM50]PAY15620.1 hypothetical protein CKO51_30925 [Rhodopirellula sp. SM50]